jgi:hypothetical protein
VGLVKQSLSQKLGVFLEKLSRFWQGKRIQKRKSRVVKPLIVSLVWLVRSNHFSNSSSVTYSIWPLRMIAWAGSPRISEMQILSTFRIFHRAPLKNPSAHKSTAISIPPPIK